jgi:hypothetical protein
MNFSPLPSGGEGTGVRGRGIEKYGEATEELASHFI